MNYCNRFVAFCCLLVRDIVLLLVITLSTSECEKSKRRTISQRQKLKCCHIDKHHHLINVQAVKVYPRNEEIQKIIGERSLLVRGKNYLHPVTVKVYKIFPNIFIVRIKKANHSRFINLHL